MHYDDSDVLATIDDAGVTVAHNKAGWFWMTRPRHGWTLGEGEHVRGPFPTAIDAARNAVARLGLPVRRYATSAAA